MINEILIYSFQVAMIFSLLFIPYLFMRNDTFFIRNRIYLIASVFISIILPFLKYEIPDSDSTTTVLLEEISIYPSMTKAVSKFSFFEIAGNIFIGIAILFLIRFIISITKIIFMILKNPKEKKENETIVWLKDGGDFSFFNYVFLSKEKYHPYILEHERVHVRSKHSYDILMLELFRCFQWFNPFVWMAITEMKAQHEYEADEFTSKANKNEYQALLLSSVLEADLVHMTNSFHCLTIKKRFVMMNKKRSPKSAAAKTLIVLPFVFLSIGIFAMNSPILDFKLPAVVIDGGEEEGEVVQPEYVGGMDALVKFLSENIKYPEKAKTDNVSGKVYVSFVISKTGKVKDAKVIKSVSSEIDAEALRVIKSMPDWTPGTKGGKKADVEMTLPINFQL